MKAWIAVMVAALFAGTVEFHGLSHANTGGTEIILVVPATAQEGDILLALVATTWGDQSNPIHGGWTLLSSALNGNKVGITALHRTATATDAGTSYTFTGLKNNGGNTGIILAYSGIQTPAAASGSSGNGATLTTPSLAGAAQGDLLVVAFARQQTSTTMALGSDAGSAAMAVRFDGQATYSGQTPPLMVADDILATDVLSGSDTGQRHATAPNGFWASLAVLLKQTPNPAVAAAVTDSTGAVLTGAAWGGWSAVPGETVTSQNYLRVVNAGNVPSVDFVVDFDTIFEASSPPGSIPIDGRMRFACVTDSEAPFAPDTAALSTALESASWSPTGSIQCTLPALDAAVFLAYNYQVPDPAPDATYSAGVTVDPA